MITVNQGIDPANAAFIAGGGAAGVNAVAIGRRLGCHTVLVPETGAVLAAAGALVSDLMAHLQAMFHTDSRAFDLAGVNAVLQGLEARCRDFAKGTGADPAALLDWSSLNHDTLWAFQAAYPDRHSALRLALISDIRAVGFDLGSQAAIIDRVMSEALGQALATGGDGEVIAFFSTVRDSAIFLAATNPRGCGSLGLTGLELVGPEAAIAERLSARADNAVAALFRSIGEGRGRPAPSRDAYEAALARFAAGLVSSGLFSDQEWVLFDRAERDPPRFCLVFAKLMDAMLSAPPETRSALLRGFALYE